MKINRQLLKKYERENKIRVFDRDGYKSVIPNGDILGIEIFRFIRLRVYEDDSFVMELAGDIVSETMKNKDVIKGLAEKLKIIEDLLEE